MIMNRRAGIALAIVILGAAAVPLAAQQGVATVAPEWAEVVKTYATIEALFADSVFASWDGEQRVTVRLRVLEIVKGEPDRFLAGGTFDLEPGSGPLRLADLMPAMLIGSGAPVVRWTNEVYSVPGTFLHPSGWDEKQLATLLENFPIDWTTEALLVIGLTAVEERELPEVAVVPLLVVRPYHEEPPEDN